jgi:hypothetical protein
VASGQTPDAKKPGTRSIVPAFFFYSNLKCRLLLRIKPFHIITIRLIVFLASYKKLKSDIKTAFHLFFAPRKSTSICLNIARDFPDEP